MIMTTMDFYSPASKTFRALIECDGTAVDIRNNAVTLTVKGAETQVFDADVTTAGETGYAYLQCDFTVPPGVYAMELAYIVDGKAYIMQRELWRCIATL